MRHHIRVIVGRLSNNMQSADSRLIKLLFTITRPTIEIDMLINIGRISLIRPELELLKHGSGNSLIKAINFGIAIATV